MKTTECVKVDGVLVSFKDIKVLSIDTDRFGNELVKFVYAGYEYGSYIYNK